MNRLIPLLLSLIFSIPAYAGPEMRAVTPSGLPDMIFKNTAATEASGKLANMCMNRGLTVASTSTNEVLCQVPMNILKSALTQALIGNSYSTTPIQYIRFSIAQINSDTRVQAASWVETQMAFGQLRREPLTSDNLYNDLMNFMEASGGDYVPGTTFPNHAFIGSGGGRGEIINHNGKKIGAIVLLDLVYDGPLHKAGAQIGDTIFSINKKTFKTYGEFQKRLQGINIGEPVRVTVLRQGQPVDLTFTATRRPPITDIGGKLPMLSTRLTTNGVEQPASTEQASTQGNTHE
ncbi:PDZ domain-containing protein [Sphingosinicella sp.]|uniref:PDZ domain-containing protein n=1 Tax=Sphingosinicella sp. TaxID=1917971 RepID=UPI0035AF8A81